MKSLVLALLVSSQSALAAGPLTTVTCKDHPTKLTYQLSHSEAAVASVTVEGVQLTELEQAFAPVYQDGKFLYNKWTFSGRFKSGTQDQLVSGDYIEVLRTGNFFRELTKHIAVAHYIYESGQLLASVTTGCK